MISLRLTGMGLLALLAGLSSRSTPTPAVAAGGQLKVLIVGGGPNPDNNQVAIESNVRYVHRLLPEGSWERVLFANGNPDSKNVLCTDEQNHTYFRKPDVPRLDGPSEIDNVKSEIKGLADSVKQDGNPVLLYFTGHGSPDELSDYQDNFYDLWNKGRFSVKELSASLADFPSNTPITLVMVECFSGAFGNTLFENGDPNGVPTNRHICGFFASVSQRMAAGCTPEVNELDYKDFTGYFFAALTGTDRMGRKVTGADYEHNGKIGMDEAFAYSLIHDDSIDTPVCTSDVFLRRFVKTPDKDVTATPYSQVLSWASPPQAAALEALSSDLGLEGDARLEEAYRTFMKMNPQSELLNDVRLIRFVRLGKSVVLGHILETGSNSDLKRRYKELKAEEAGNPLAK